MGLVVVAVLQQQELELPFLHVDQEMVELVLQIQF
jgi:hypothetical protein